MDIDYKTLKEWGNMAYEMTKLYFYPWLYISENYIFTKQTLTKIRNYRKKQQKTELKEKLIENIKID